MDGSNTLLLACVPVDPEDKDRIYWNNALLEKYPSLGLEQYAESFYLPLTFFSEKEIRDLWKNEQLVFAVEDRVGRRGAYIPSQNFDIDPFNEGKKQTFVIGKKAVGTPLNELFYSEQIAATVREYLEETNAAFNRDMRVISFFPFDTTQQDSRDVRPIGGQSEHYARKAVRESELLLRGYNVYGSPIRHCPVLAASPMPRRYEKIIERVSPVYSNAYTTIRYTGRIYQETRFMPGSIRTLDKFSAYDTFEVHGWKVPDSIKTLNDGDLHSKASALFGENGNQSEAVIKKWIDDIFPYFDLFAKCLKNRWDLGGRRKETFLLNGVEFGKDAILTPDGSYFVDIEGAGIGRFKKEKLEYNAVSQFSRTFYRMFVQYGYCIGEGRHHNGIYPSILKLAEIFPGIDIEGTYVRLLRNALSAGGYEIRDSSASMECIQSDVVNYLKRR